MKKLVLFALILCVSVSAVFAVNNFVNVSASPFAFQTYSSFAGTELISDYGFGFKAGYRHFVGKFLVGVDMSYQNYRYRVNSNPVILGGVQILAKVGGKLAFSEKVDLNVDFGAGVNIGISRLSTNYNPMIGANISLSFNTGRNLSVTAGVDYYLEWAKAKDSEFRSTQWSTVPSIGLEIEL